MEFSDNNLYSGSLNKESTEDRATEGTIGEIQKGRTWEEIEHKEIELINGMEGFLGKASQHICNKSKEIMKEWKQDS